jgi:hypothetical protein
MTRTSRVTGHQEPVTREGSRGRARMWLARGLAAAVAGTLLLLAYAGRLALARLVLELLLRLGQLAG